MAAKPTICTLPEELRQEVISYLTYWDAWSLKQTAKLFHRVVEIPTIKSFLEQPDGSSLRVLEDCTDWLDRFSSHEACWYCRQILPRERFSRLQRQLTGARQTSFDYDFTSYKPEKHFCIRCGVKHGRYKRGQKIYTGFGDPGYREEGVVPCTYCGKIVESGSLGCELCSGCRSCIKLKVSTKDEDPPVSGFDRKMNHCKHKAITKDWKAVEIVHCLGPGCLTLSDDDFQPEPHPLTYVEANSRYILALAGEGYMPGSML